MEILKFEDYRLFLREMIRRRPQKGRGEVTRIAKKIRVHPTFVSQVLHGSKTLSGDQAFEVAQYFNLSPGETKYFLLLTELSRAGTVNLKKYLKEEIENEKSRLQQVSHRIGDHRKLSDSDKAVFYSSWLFSAVRLATSLGAGQTLEQICNRFPLSRTRALEILTFLCSTGLCTETQGRYQLGTIHTHVDRNSPFSARHHSNWRIKSIQRQEDLTNEELGFTAPFSVSKKDFNLIKENILVLVKETTSIVGASDAEDIACMNIDLFWIRP